MKRLFIAAALAALAFGSAGGAQTIAPVSPYSSPAVSSGWVASALPTHAYHLSATSGASAGYLLVLDATAIPSAGAVTPKFCRAVAANASVPLSFSSPATFQNGIVMLFSTTGCYTYTVSSTAFFEASFK